MPRKVDTKDMNATKQGLKIRHLVRHLQQGRIDASRYGSYPWGAIRTALKESVDCSYMFVGDTYFKSEGNR